ncbi:unnamed protein product [Penicillium salamii]|uniref:Uncharacterized protein n=1 Tax=Penicillium salamii TaxID=1612424 RepID=A0A9W4JNQ6_9EURO|nr:unnamed protein product [Penicillium salamii]CAG8291732.1 unnamed protein product [Penicillium salamii]CAG8368198.1 unnamed protein product [Penicillium salamii]CAG8377020.1 unnamed protein product [Penicillium salamii]CAG8379111.1 unnamed protein product [Penicillium salamii]
MFRSAFRPFSSLRCTRSARTARCLHRVTTEFIIHDTRGNLVTRKVPIFIGNPGETYILIEKEVGSALRAASPFISTSAASAEDRCKLTFFHDSQHFGFGTFSVCERFYSIEVNIFFSLLGSSSYPRLYIPNQMPRQTELNTSSATLLLDGKMHEIVLDGTPDGIISSQLFPYYVY